MPNRKFYTPPGTKLYPDYESEGPMTPEQYAEVIAAKKAAATREAGAGGLADDLGLTPTKSRYDEKVEEFYQQFTIPTEEREEKIRETKRAGVQAQIDAINKAFAEAIEKRERMGVEELGKERAIAARTGILTSDIGRARLKKEKIETREAVESIQARKGLAVQEILARADERAEKEIELRRGEAITAQADYLDYLKDVRDEAREEMKQLAKTGNAPLERLKVDNSEYYKQYLEETGYPEPIFDLLWESYRPEEAASKVLFKEVTAEGKLKILWQDASGATFTQEYDWEGKTEVPEIIDGRPYNAIKDESGRIVRYELIPGIVEEPKEYVPPTSYKEWELAGKPGTYADWLKKSKETVPKSFLSSSDIQELVTKGVPKAASEAIAIALQEGINPEDIKTGIIESYRGDRAIEYTVGEGGKVTGKMEAAKGLQYYDSFMKWLKEESEKEFQIYVPKQE